MSVRPGFFQFVIASVGATMLVMVENDPDDVGSRISKWYAKAQALAGYAPSPPEWLTAPVVDSITHWIGAACVIIAFGWFIWSRLHKKTGTAHSHVNNLKLKNITKTWPQNSSREWRETVKIRDLYLSEIKPTSASGSAILVDGHHQIEFDCGIIYGFDYKVHKDFGANSQFLIFYMPSSARSADALEIASQNVKQYLSEEGVVIKSVGILPGQATMRSGDAQLAPAGAPWRHSSVESRAFIPNIKRTIIADDPDYPDGEDVLEFRLTYQGELLGPTGGNNRVSHKHEIRKQLHPQLKRLWQVAPQLSSAGFGAILLESAPRHLPHTVEELSKRFSRCGYSFVPLVTSSINLYCELEILFLRPDAPGSILQSGDIDNRIKTLFDALRIPSDAAELGKYSSPSDTEVPFYCLLEDDRLITKVSVETDVLLQPTDEKFSTNSARLVITVRLRPIVTTLQNLPMG